MSVFKGTIIITWVLAHLGFVVHTLVITVAQCSFARDGPLSDPESHGSVSSVAQSSFAGDDSFSGLVYTPVSLQWGSSYSCRQQI